MPRRDDLHRILVLGSGPIVIGQACEFDYSGTQAVKALRADGYQVVLVNSNPATIMTDPDMADRTYIEPLTREFLEAIIARERPDGLLPTVGGQTALNLTLQLHEDGVLTKYGVEVIGARLPSIQVAEDRQLFRAAMLEIGLDVPRSAVVTEGGQAEAFAEQEGYPVVVRPSFTLGGSGGGIAYNTDELGVVVQRGLSLSPIQQVLVEECLLGWKEYELEVMRDGRDNVVVVCSIENVDPMGIHTGDSITVAPAQTLTDHEYQQMRDAAAAILRRVGVDTGGANVQFAVHPDTGRLVVIEMNPRVSRSSALASKATGFPIAKIAARLAVGYALDELLNDITRQTPAAFEPALDYVVTKIPKFTFEKFPGADQTLGTQMKSVGEVMAIGRTLKESLGKALRAIEAEGRELTAPGSREELAQLLMVPNERRLHWVRYAFTQGWSVQEVNRATHIDPWFLDQVQQIVELESTIRGTALATLSEAKLRELKAAGLSDRRLASLLATREEAVRDRRRDLGVRPVFKRVDTCAAEFVSLTPYLYSTYEVEDESEPQEVRKVVILGSGPNRIGQGIEFDYCCCHAAAALREEGVQSIMVNCNPETVSTDYDTSDRLYFEALTAEDVLEVMARERPAGVIVQFGGQTPLNLVKPLSAAGVPLLGTAADSIDLAEDRERFSGLLTDLEIRHPAHAFALNPTEARAAAARLGYPVLVRPSYVLGGRAMTVIHNEALLDRAMHEAIAAAPDAQVLIDHFLPDAVEIDVDALADGDGCVLAGVLQHIEQAGVHSGDSAAVLPPYKLSARHLTEIGDTTRRLARALAVQGLMNVQYAICEDDLYVLEVNPRASRTVPFIAKATGVPVAKLATRLMLGRTLAEVGLTADLKVTRQFVKAPVFPFAKFPGVDPRLSPEMRSTGEVMGQARQLGIAYHKAMLAAGVRLPNRGTALITVNDHDKEAVIPIATRLAELGFDIAATRGTAKVLEAAGLPVRPMLKLSEGRPNLNDAIQSGEIALVINTPLGAGSYRDGWAMRTTTVLHQVPCITTLSGAAAVAEAIASARIRRLEVASLQEIYGDGQTKRPTTD